MHNKIGIIRIIMIRLMTLIRIVVVVVGRGQPWQDGSRTRSFHQGLEDTRNFTTNDFTCHIRESYLS